MRAKFLLLLYWAFSILVLIMLPTLPADAGGLSLYEVATADVGLASAGWAARAQDPSTLLKNPAGMSLIGGQPVSGWTSSAAGGTQF